MRESEQPLREVLQEGILPAPTPKEVAPVGREEKRSVTSQNLFTRPEAHPVVLDLALLKIFGAEWFTWLLDTVLWEIERELKTSVADTNKVKIAACMNLHVGEDFWGRWEIFEKTLHSLVGNVTRIDLLHPPELGVLYAGVSMANQVRPEPFQEEVARYCAAVHRFHEVCYAPAPLDFCQTYLSDPRYRCKDCGTEGSALPPFDDRCPACAGTFAHDHPFAFRPPPGEKGKNLEFFLRFDPALVRQRFEALDPLSGDLTSKLQETSEDQQAALLLDAKDTERFWERNLQDQMRGLQGWLS